MDKLLRKSKTIWSIASFILAISIGVGVELMGWGEVWQGWGLFIICFGTVVAITLYIYGYIKYKRSRPRLKGENKRVTASLWEIYKIIQKVVEKDGKKGLEGQKLYEVKVITQKALKVPTIQYHKSLDDKEAIELIQFMSKRMKIRTKKVGVFNKNNLNQMWILGNILERCGVGVNALSSKNKKYEAVKERLNRESSLNYNY